MRGNHVHALTKPGEMDYRSVVTTRTIKPGSPQQFEQSWLLPAIQGR